MLLQWGARASLACELVCVTSPLWCTNLWEHCFHRAGNCIFQLGNVGLGSKIPIKVKTDLISEASFLRKSPVIRRIDEISINSTLSSPTCLLRSVFRILTYFVRKFFNFSLISINFTSLLSAFILRSCGTAFQLGGILREFRKPFL